MSVESGGPKGIPAGWRGVPGSHDEVKKEAAGGQRWGKCDAPVHSCLFKTQFMPSFHWGISSSGVGKGQPARSFPEWHIRQTLGPVEG